MDYQPNLIHLKINISTRKTLIKVCFSYNIIQLSTLLYIFSDGSFANVPSGNPQFPPLPCCHPSQVPQDHFHLRCCETQTPVSIDWVVTCPTNNSSKGWFCSPNLLKFLALPRMSWHNDPTLWKIHFWGAKVLKWIWGFKWNGKTRNMHFLKTVGLIWWHIHTW